MKNTIISIFQCVLYIIIFFIFIINIVGFIFNGEYISCIFTFLALFLVCFIESLFFSFLIFQKKLIVFKYYKIHIFNYNEILKIQVSTLYYRYGNIITIRIIARDGRVIKCEIGQMFSERLTINKIKKLCCNRVKLEFLQ